MMKRRIFERTTKIKGAVGLQTHYGINGMLKSSNTENKYIVVAITSPFASSKRNHQLEKDLYKAYMRYYIRTLVDNCGLFWEQPTNEDCKEDC